MTSEAIIRPYRPSDRDAVRRLCCETGYLGKAIDPVFEDRELFADYLTRFYTDREPESTFVLEQDGASARVMAKDHGFAVPMDASGTAIAYGVLQEEPISAEHARHLVEDDGAQAPADKELRIVATAISIAE